MNLDEILHEQNCLCYLVQFLDTTNALPLIKFYLEAESFQTGATTICTQPVDTMSVCSSNFDAHSEISSTTKISDIIEESNNNVTVTEVEDKKKQVPDFCDLKMETKPLTDDEKNELKIQLKQRFSSSVANDAIRIYKKYLIPDAPYFLDESVISSTIHSEISLALCNVDENGQLDTATISTLLFADAQKQVLEKLDSDYLTQFLQSSFYCKYVLDVLASSQLQLSDLLHNDIALFYFMEYLEEHDRLDEKNFLEFWLSAMNFRKHYMSSDLKQSQNDAMILYEKYFSLQSSSPLRISDSVRSIVEEKICSLEESDIAKCFDLPLKIIEEFFEENHVRQFLRSQIFTNYINDLKVKACGQKELQDKRKNRHRKSKSDCSSEQTKSIRSKISHHKLLRQSESIGACANATNLQIDFKILSNPDLLWKRSNSINGESLSFGRVDEMGRYERDFPDGHIPGEEDKWSLASGGNKIKNAVRKLVNLPEEKVQEEIAWRVAEMIVKDVTSVTLAGGK